MNIEGGFETVDKTAASPLVMTSMQSTIAVALCIATCELGAPAYAHPVAGDLKPLIENCANSHANCA